MKVNVKQKRIPYEFRLPNGKVLFRIEEAVLSHERFDSKMTPDITRVNFNRGDGIAVLLYTEETNEVVLVEQFRYPIYSSGGKGGWILEVVAGVKDGASETVAQQEILEETGYRLTGKLEHMTTFYVSPGGTSERIELYLAKVGRIDGIHPQGGVTGDGEDIRTHVVPLDEALRMVADGRIVDGKTVVGLLMLREKLRG